MSKKQSKKTIRVEVRMPVALHKALMEIEAVTDSTMNFIVVSLLLDGLQSYRREELATMKGQGSKPEPGIAGPKPGSTVGVDLHVELIRLGFSKKESQEAELFEGPDCFYITHPQHRPVRVFGSEVHFIPDTEGLPDDLKLVGPKADRPALKVVEDQAVKGPVDPAVKEWGKILGDPPALDGHEPEVVYGAEDVLDLNDELLKMGYIEQEIQESTLYEGEDCFYIFRFGLRSVVIARGYTAFTDIGEQEFDTLRRVVGTETSKIYSLPPWERSADYEPSRHEFLAFRWPKLSS